MTERPTRAQVADKRGFLVVVGAVMTKDRCRGCEDNVYNGELAKECWSFAGALIVRKKQVHVDQYPPWTQAAEELPDCFRARRFISVRPDQMQ